VRASALSGSPAAVAALLERTGGGDPAREHDMLEAAR